MLVTIFKNLLVVKHEFKPTGQTINSAFDVKYQSVSQGKKLQEKAENTDSQLDPVP
jgi:hypothetical protein